MSQRALITETRPSICAKNFFWRIFSQPLQCKLIVYTFLNLSFVKYHVNEADSARRVWPGKVHFPPFFARGSQRSSLKSFRRDPGFQSGAGWMDLVAQGNFPETEEDTTKQIIAFTRSLLKRRTTFDISIIWFMTWFIDSVAAWWRGSDLNSRVELSQQRRPEEETLTVSAVFRTVCERGL